MLVFTSCGVNSYVMFKSADEEVITDSIPLAPSEEYRLAKNDKISLKLYVEGGARVIFRSPAEISIILFCNLF